MSDLQPGKYHENTDMKPEVYFNGCENCSSQDHDYGDTYATELIPCQDCVEAEYSRFVTRLVDFVGDKGPLAEMLYTVLRNNTFQNQKGNYKSSCTSCFCITEFSYCGATFTHYPDCYIAQARNLVGLPFNVIERPVEEYRELSEDIPF